MTPGGLAAEKAKAARTVAAYAMVRAMLARYLDHGSHSGPVGHRTRHGGH